MFAYCNNNPIAYKDIEGELGIFALCVIGAVTGALVDYAGQVISNYAARGMSGAEAWTAVDIGSIAGSAFSGAVSAIPGGGAIASVVDAVGSNLIDHGIDAIMGEEFNVNNVVSDIGTDLLLGSISSKSTPDVPKYIRDIKDEAREYGVKGAKKLKKYLNISQVSTIVINAFNSKTQRLLLEKL